MLFELPDPDAKPATDERSPDEPAVPRPASVPTLVEETTDMQRAISARMLMGG